MQIKTQQKESGLVLEIEGSVDIEVIHDLHRVLCESIEQNSELAVDLSGVDACDTTALQLFSSGYKTARNLNKQLRFRGISQAVQKTAVALGLTINDQAQTCTEVLDPNSHSKALSGEMVNVL